MTDKWQRCNTHPGCAGCALFTGFAVFDGRQTREVNGVEATSPGAFVRNRMTAGIRCAHCRAMRRNRITAAPVQNRWRGAARITTVPRLCAAV